MALADFLYEKILSKFRFEPTECQLQLFKDLAAFTYNGGESDEWVHSIIKSINDNVRVLCMFDYLLHKNMKNQQFLHQKLNKSLL